MTGSNEFEKEEYLLLMISLLIEKYSKPFEHCIPECPDEIEKACAFLQERYTEHIYLDQICKYTSLSKTTLIRAFTKSKGVTPYRYLQNIRINEAKKLLEQGIPPIEVAMQAGFSDQSHFTNFFNKFIGLSPRVYRDIFIKNIDKGGIHNGKE
jgi:AraC-like DNA-binding protein